MRINRRGRTDRDTRIKKDPARKQAGQRRSFGKAHCAVESKKARTAADATKRYAILIAALAAFCFIVLAIVLFAKTEQLFDFGSLSSPTAAVISETHTDGISGKDISEAKEVMRKEFLKMDIMIAEAKIKADSLYDHLPEDMKNIEFGSDEQALIFFSDRMADYEKMPLAQSETVKKETEAVSAAAQYYLLRYNKENKEKFFNDILESGGRLSR